MKLSEMFQAVDLLHYEWDLGKTEAKAKGSITKGFIYEKVLN